MESENVAISTSYIDQLANENEEENKEIILAKAIDCLLAQEERRSQELFDFIDDFITSPEYFDYVNAKKKIMKRSTAIQCNENDIIVEVQRRNIIEKYPLMEEQMKMFAFQEQFEKYAKRQTDLEIRKKQEKAIKAIRERINEAKKYFNCTRYSVQRKRGQRDEYLLQHYSSKIGINLTNLFSLKSRARILERIKKHHRLVSLRKERKRQNIFNIMEKLIYDYGVKKAIKKDQSKTYDYKVKRNEKIIKDMEVVGTKIELIDELKVSEVSEASKTTKSTQPSQPEVEMQDVKKKKDIKEKEKNEKTEKNEKQGKKPKDKPTKEKKDNKTEKQEVKLELPFVPIVNPREKIFAENIDQLLDLVEEFRHFDGEMENKDMMIEKHKREYILDDTGLASKPKSILFQNYDEKKVYYKTVIITNVSCEIRKVRFLKFSFENQYDQVIFDVENFGIQQLYTGCHCKFLLRFQPYDALKSYEGRMTFLSYDLRKCQYYQFEVNIKCLPKYSNLQVCPKRIDFGRMAIWKAKSENYSKTLKIQNKGSISCTVYIHKIQDPLDIEAILEENNKEKDDNKENIAPSCQNSVTNTTSELELCIQEIIYSCIDNIDNYFCFEETFFTLFGMEETTVKVFFKHADYVGNYFEKYTVDVYQNFIDGGLDILGCQEITLLAETTGHFLTVNPEILDFGTCHVNTCYQLSFEMCSSSKYTQAISMRFPSSVVDMIHADISTVYLPPQGKRIMWFKFLPRDYIYRDSCLSFDKNTSILEFPIHLYVVSKMYLDYPPVKIPVYAILSNIEDITILTSPKCSLSNFLDTILIDLRTCSVYETIWTEIHLQNNSTLIQFCGFLDLPQCVTIEPNQGFVKLYPNQQKTFKLYFSPEIRDFPSFPIGSLRNNKYFFKLRMDTISSIGQTKKAIPTKKLKNTMDVMLKELEKNKASPDMSLFDYVTDLKNSMATEISHSMVNKGMIEGSTDALKGPDCYSTMPVNVFDLHAKSDDHISSWDDTVLNYQNFVIVETNSRKIIWCKVSLRRPMLEFSHQVIEFPDTPCGSYSVMEIRLSAVDKAMEADCEDATTKRRNRMDYTASFMITGGSDEISIEPKCGSLRAGESIKITLLAKPNVPKEMVEKTAKSIKYSEIYELKLREYRESKSRKDAKKEKEIAGNKGKDKKNDKASDVTKKDLNPKKNQSKDVKKTQKEEVTTEPVIEEVPNFIITDKEMEFNYLDLYPAEMVYWRDMEAYYIKAEFTCRIEYQQGLKIHKKPDWIYLSASCKVMRPDFITDLKIQRLDFGKCTIGMSTSKQIMLQNISYDYIEVTTSLLNPVCCFSIPLIRDLMVPSEHSLKLPLNFSPVSTDKVTEYMEIRANATVLPLILCGEGVVPNINITPNFTVFRLETKQNHLAELYLKIENASESPVDIRLEKLFEIEGRLSDCGKDKEEVKEDPKASKNKKEKEQKSSGKDKGPKFSDSLTDQELEAIDECCTNVKGDSYFDLSITEKIPLAQNSNYTITIFFGDPESLQKRKSDKPKKGVKGNAVKGVPSEVLGSKKIGEKKAVDSEKNYITQYNVFVGKTFVKSIVLLCTKL